jgi:hypothetical protein
MSTNIGWFDRHPARLAARLLPRSRRRHPTWREILTRVLPKDRRWDDVADALEVVRAEIEKAACRPADRPVPKLTVALELRAEGRPVRYLYNRLKSEKHNYGQWRTREVVLSFSPSPKRDRIVGRHVAGRTWAELSVRRFDDIDGESHVYDRFVLSEDARALRLATEIALEQPSGDDMTEYEDDDRR